MKRLAITCVAAALAAVPETVLPQTPGGGTRPAMRRPFETLTVEGQPIDRRPPQLDTDHPVFPGQTHAP
jgi:hypothetical protein